MTAHARPRVSEARSGETHEVVRLAVRELLERSDAFRALDKAKRRDLASGLVEIATQLAAPGGVRVPVNQMSQPVIALAEDGMRCTRTRTGASAGGTLPGERKRAPTAGELLQVVDFPGFVAGLINGVFGSIVTASIQQMEAYAKLVSDVAKSLDQFVDDSTTPSQGRAHSIENAPDRLQFTMQGASRRQQLLANMIMFGVNRIVVTDGEIGAKVTFDPEARDAQGRPGTPKP